MLSAIRRAGNTIGSIARRVGSIGGQVIRRVGQFVEAHHPSIAVVSKAIAEHSGNPTLKKVANGISMASNTYSAIQNYNKGTHLNRAPFPNGGSLTEGKVGHRPPSPYAEGKVAVGIPVNK
jgi:hypothetical protein